MLLIFCVLTQAFRARRSKTTRNSVTSTCTCTHHLGLYLCRLLCVLARVGADVPSFFRLHFCSSVKFVKEMKFERAGVFAYSEEEGTPAATMAQQVLLWGTSFPCPHIGASPVLTCFVATLYTPAALP